MKEPKGYLTLDSREGVMKAARLAPAGAGKPADSKLIHAMKYVDPHLQMPPSGKLADEVIADFEAVDAGGAPDPRRRERDHGSHQAARRRRSGVAEGAAVVGVFKRSRCCRSRSLRMRRRRERSSIILYTPERKRKDSRRRRKPTTERDSPRVPRTIGLKPTYEKSRRTPQMRRPNKYERLIDTLLEKPQYGEAGDAIGRRRPLRRRHPEQSPTRLSTRMALSRLGHRGAE